MEHLPHHTYPITSTITYQKAFSCLPYAQISPPQTDYCVALDLTKKRSPSPCYHYNYPSPKPSPNYISVVPSRDCQSSFKQSPTYGAVVPSIERQPSPKLSPTSTYPSVVMPVGCEPSPKASHMHKSIPVMSSNGCQPSSKPSPTHICNGCQSNSTLTPTYVSPTSSTGCLATCSPRSEVSETSCCSSSDVTSSPRSRMRGTRPFKAFPKDPLVLSLGAVSGGVDTSSIIWQQSLTGVEDSEITKFLIGDSFKAYSEFRHKMMDKITHDNGTNKNMRRNQHQSNKIHDPEYLEKRKKNNEAAKKSRDARRNKQDEIAIRVTFLEQENLMLRYRLEAEKEDLERLQKSKRL